LAFTSLCHLETSICKVNCISRIDHYNAVIVNAQEYYPFGMLMPGRGGQIGRGRNKAGSIIQNGDTIPAKLTVTQRTNNLPAMYMATEAINFEEGFMSGTADEFTTLMADQSNADAGSDNGVSYGITAKGYRYGFNGKENDNEVKGEGNEQDYGMRVYDPGLGKFLSVDPLTPKYPELTPYQFASNKPINSIDLDGLESWELTTPRHNLEQQVTMKDNKQFLKDQEWLRNMAMNVPVIKQGTPGYGFIAEQKAAIKQQMEFNNEMEARGKLDMLSYGGAGFGLGLARDPVFRHQLLV
jgi:RHS repeat-associated protein